jgi:hypothetical protein
MKVDIIQLRGPAPKHQCDFAIADMVQRARVRGHDVHFPQDVFGSSLITRSRNRSLRHVRWDGDFVLFVDDDMLPMQGALTRLMGHNVPVVSALCTTRTIPATLTVKHYDSETGDFKVVDQFQEETLIKGPWAPGFGFILIKTSVLKFILEYVLGAHDWLDSNRKLFDRLHSRAEFREAERERLAAVRRRMWEAEQYAPVFQLPLHTERQQEIGEDSYFAKMLHQTGTEVWLDTGCLVGHVGEFPYSPLNFGMRHVSEVQL